METRWTKNPSRWELEWGIRKIPGGLKNHLSCTVSGRGPTDVDVAVPAR